ncbi:MAG: lipoyl(octanoyl) transferase LipB [Thermoprotei archaeon]
MVAYVCDLGLMDYASSWQLQKKLVERKAAGLLQPDYVLLVEHPHVFTLGRKGNADNILVDDVPVYHVERGGDVTYHGPGQQVIYPIVDLTKVQLSVKGYLRSLEQIIIGALGEFGINARAIEGKTGVWVGEKKIASIGVAVDRWIAYHGAALNVNTDMSYFYKIRPCGMPSEVMTSMEKVLGHKVDLAEVKRSIIKSYTRAIGVTLIPIEKVSLESELFGEVVG